MNLDFIKPYVNLISDKKDPAGRVLLKSLVTSLIFSGYLVWYRHVILGLGFDSAITTFLLCFNVVMAFGVLAASFSGWVYQSFLEEINADRAAGSIHAFMVESMIAAFPSLAAGFYYFGFYAMS